MKLCLIGLLGCWIAATTLHAADPFVAPSFVKELEDLEKVQTKAASEQKGVAFLLMEPGST